MTSDGSGVRFARRVFNVAAIYGFVVMVPQYFLERSTGVRNPPAITHPEYFYGFIGVALAWQLVFFMIARDPVRYRPIMLAAIVEKVSFGVATIVLYAMGRLHGEMLGAGILDLILMTLFVVSYARTRDAAAAAGA